MGMQNQNRSVDVNINSANILNPHPSIESNKIEVENAALAPDNMDQVVEGEN